MAVTELYFCGKCKQQQQTGQGVKCKRCGGPTVSYDPTREGETAAQKKWDRLYGKG